MAERVHDDEYDTGETTVPAPPPTPTGSVIVLNGPSSAGKSTLAAALQRRLAAEGECWFVYAMDDYFAKVPFDWVTAGRHVGVHADDGVTLEIVDGEFRMRMGPIGRRVLVAWRGAVGSAARAGLNVIADDVVLTEDEWRGWQDELADVDAHWVRVQIALDVLEARERERSGPDARPRAGAVRGLVPLAGLRRRGRHRGARARRRGGRRPRRMAGALRLSGTAPLSRAGWRRTGRGGVRRSARTRGARTSGCRRAGPGLTCIVLSAEPNRSNSSMARSIGCPPSSRWHRNSSGIVRLLAQPRYSS